MIFHCRFFALAIIAMCWALDARATVLPLREDFESSAGGFTSGGATWKWGVPATGPGSAHSGTQAWGTNLTGNYANSEDAILTSPDYDLSASAGNWIVVHWWQSVVTELGYDWALVEVSKNGGGNWETIFGPRSGAISAGWSQQTILLDPSHATVNFRIRFRLISDEAGTDAGYYVDDLRISAAQFTPRVAVEDFEAGEAGYTAAGVNSTWAHGTPLSAPGAAHSGAASWATNLDGLYAEEEISALTSPAFDLTGAAGELIAVTWWEYLETEEGFDFASVEVSRDNGATWQAPLFSAPVSGPVSGGDWRRQQAFADPSYATAQFRVRFRLEADESFGFNGYAIDDVAIQSTADLFPITAGFARSTPMDFPLAFSAADFLAANTDPDGQTLSGIRIEQLPASGVLKLGGSLVIAGQEIPLASVGTLIYEPAAGFDGPDPFEWSSANQFGRSAPGTVAVTVLGPTPDVVIATGPSAKTVNPGASVTFEVIALSTAALSYQWRKDQQPISGADGSSYTIAAVTEGHEGAYDVVVTNDTDEEISGGAFLSVNDPVSFIAEPAPLTVNEGAEAVFAVEATGSGRLDYQWLKNNQPIPDATFPVLKIEEVTPDDAASFACVVTNVVGAKTTAAATLTVRLAPRISVQPISAGRLVKKGIQLSVAASGAGNLTYQWLKDGEEIPGATSPVLNLLKLGDLNSGEYTVRVSNDFATTESEPAKLSVFRWRQLAGTYQDVLLLDDSEALNTAPYIGRITAAISAGGVVTAMVNYRGERHVFTRKFGEELVVENTITRGGRSPLTVRLELDTADETIFAVVTEIDAGVEWRSTALLPRNAFHSSRNPVPQAGQFNLVLSPSPDAVDGPRAPAYAVSTILKSGRAVMKMELPNGRVVAASAVVDPYGRIPLYAALAKSGGGRRGEIVGRLEIQGTGSSQTIAGMAVWSEPVATPRSFLPAPFNALLEAEGSIYVRPPRGESVLVLPVGTNQMELQIDGPLSGAPLTRFVRILNPNSFFVDPETVEKLRFRAGLNTGLVVGSYFDVATKRLRRIKGVTLQAQGEIRGFVRAGDNAGAFWMGPYIP